ncbi:MAG: hypothetical protein AB1505_04000 [Candidatus Latescibacterota bacterium]
MQPYAILRPWAALSLVVLCLPVSGSAARGSQDRGPAAADEALRLSGVLAAYAKYNSSPRLVQGQTEGQDTGESLAGQPALDLRLARSWGTRWWLDAGYAGQADLHTDDPDNDWYFSRGHLALVRALGPHALSISSELRYLTVPGHDRYDFLRHTGLVGYRRALSPRWEGRLGYDNVLTRYVHSSGLDYLLHGLRLELATTWSPRLSARCAYGIQAYRGSYDPLEGDPNTSPDEGFRHTVELGCDWLLSGAQALGLTYAFQVDRSEMGLGPIGPFEGHEDSQDAEAEFALTKHKATVLYARRLTGRLAFSSYLEWIRKDFDDEDDAPLQRQGRTDALYLSASHVKLRWSERLVLRLRYLYRTNRSTLSAQDYANHIVAIGPEYAF